MGDFILPFFLDWYMYFDDFVVSTHTDRNNLLKIGNLTAFIREGLDLFFIFFIGRYLKPNKNVSAHKSTPTPRNYFFIPYLLLVLNHTFVDVLTLTNIP
ncbi:hypothetical protein ACDX66_25365 [Peribacillus frigoritolerans]